MTWTALGIIGAFGLGALGLATWVVTHLEASLGQQIAQQGALFGATFDRFGSTFDRFERLVDERFSHMDRRFDLVDQRLDRVEGRLDRVEDRLTSLEGGFRDLRADLTDHIDHHSA